jgi:myosin I
LIEQKGGIVGILDDQASFRNCSAETFTNAVKSTLRSNNYFIPPEVYQRKNVDKTEFKFGVKHYAGDVCYNSISFLDKNTEALYGDLIRVMSNSRSPFIATLFADTRSDEEKSKRPPTLGTQFKKHLGDLVNTLKTCRPHYVRCIKPNDEKSPEYVTEARVIHQIQYLGIVENVKVRRAGFCYRATYKEFAQRYRILSLKTWPMWSQEDCKGDCLEILMERAPTTWKHSPRYDALTLEQNVDFKFGRSKVFIKDPTALFKLERNRATALQAVVRIIQSSVRRRFEFARYKVMRGGFIRWQATARALMEKRRYVKKLSDIVRLQSLIRKFIQRVRFHKFVKQYQNIPPRVWALQIQARGRGYLVRRQLCATEPATYERAQEAMQKIRDSRKRLMSAICIARIVRGKLARIKHKRLVSAIRIAKIVRGKLARINYKRLVSAIRIAKIVRGKLARKKRFRRQLAWNLLRVCVNPSRNSMIFLFF